ncbi:MAG: tRNA 2-thiouridine(34) synthase MnmA, partial [Pseudomonadales bacterium]
AEYWDQVFAHFLSEYQAGRTPNPDVLCNREIKFNVFQDYAETLGADLIATGHYARLVRAGGDDVRLCKALDDDKDQSYFLQAVPRHRLASALFPLGEMTKPEVRRLAKEHGLPTHQKKDSTGICFIGERRFKDFLMTYLPAKPGDIVTLDGEVIGQHQGLMYHTLGQRQGLGIGGLASHGESPWYVADKRLEANELVVVQGNDHPGLFRRFLVTGEVLWFGDAPTAPSLRCAAKIRYRQPDQACQVRSLTGGDLPQDAQGCLVEFDEPQRAVTPGQWACFYSGDQVLGGAVIERSADSAEAIAA